MNYHNCIKDFTIAFDCFYKENFNPDDVKNNKDIAKLRYDLINEELNELCDAIYDKDFIEVIDALTDIIYVTYGAAITFGIDLNRDFVTFLIKRGLSPDENNSHFQMVNKNKDLLIRTDIFNEDNTILLDDVMFNIGTSRLIMESLRLCLLEHESIECLPQFLCELNYKIYYMCLILGINLDTSFDIVHKSNMSKLCQNENIAKKTVDSYKKNDDRYDSPFYMQSKLSDKLYIVKNKSTGKVLKSINYTPANFKKMLN